MDKRHLKKKEVPLKNCEICNLVIPRGTRLHEKRITAGTYLKRRFCSNKCRGKNYSKIYIGEKNPHWKGGAPKCINCNNKLAERYSHRISLYCNDCRGLAISGNKHPLWSGRNILSKNGRYLPPCRICKNPTGDSYSKICQKCFRGAMRPNWIGRDSSLNQLIRVSPENRKWIKVCMYRDNYKCVECGIGSKGTLTIDHIIPLSFFIAKYKIKTLTQAKKCTELWDIDNGRTLCLSCHKKTDTWGGGAIAFRKFLLVNEKENGC